MAKKTPKGAIKIDIGLNKSKGGISNSAVRQTPKGLDGSLMDKLAGTPKKPSTK